MPTYDETLLITTATPVDIPLSTAPTPQGEWWYSPEGGDQPSPAANPRRLLYLVLGGAVALLLGCLGLIGLLSLLSGR